MKKVLAIITMCILTAGIAVAQDDAKKASAPATTAPAAKKQATGINNCDMKNFYCMRAGRMTQVKDGLDVGMPVEATLTSGARIATNGTLFDSKGNATTLKEGDAIDMEGNICIMEMGATPATPTEGH